MRAVVLREFGPAGNLSYETVPDPVPGPGQVRIAVKAAGVHLVHTRMRAGDRGGPPLPELPAVFGDEVAGVVESAGEGVDPSWIGTDVVTASTSPGGYAELVVSDVAAVHRIPEGVDHRTAAAMIRTGVTALELLDQAELTPDDVVLVTSAAGGIGRLLVAYAVRLGATVVGAAGGPAKVDAVRELGAQVAIDYNAPGWAASAQSELGDRRVSVILDGVGGEKAAQAYGMLKPGGRFLAIGMASGEWFAPYDSLMGGLSYTDDQGRTQVNALLTAIQQPGDIGDLERRALAAAADGSLVPGIQAFPLSETVKAHLEMENRRTTGKVLLEP